MDKPQLFENIRRERATFTALIAPLDDAQLTAPSLGDGRSVKDVLAHLAVWEQRCTGWLEAVAHGETPDRPDVRDVDAGNARDYAAARDTTLAAVRAASAEAHTAMIAAVEALSERDLADEARFGWPAWQMASSNTSEHYREHIEQIGRWLRM